MCIGSPLAVPAEFIQALAHDHVLECQHCGLWNIKNSEKCRSCGSMKFTRIDRPTKKVFG